MWPRAKRSGALVDTGAELPLRGDNWFSVGQIQWLADGSGIIMVARAQAFEPSQLRLISYPSGKVRRLTNDLSDHGAISLTVDGKNLVTVQQDRFSNLWIFPLGESGPGRQLTIGSGRDDDPYWSSSGRIVYDSQASGNREIWSIAPDGSDKRQLTFDSHDDFAPSTSPDGKYVYFVSDRTGARNIWRMDADGLNPLRLTRGPRDNWPHCSPDGNWIYYESEDSGKPSLQKIPSSGGNPTRVCEKLARYPAVSPDGRHIAVYFWDEQPNSSTKLAVLSAGPTESGEPIKAFNFVRDPFIPPVARWTVDGLGLIYATSRGGASNLWIQPLNSDSARSLTHFDSDLIFGFDRSPDGRQVVCSRGFVSNEVVLIRNFK